MAVWFVIFITMFNHVTWVNMSKALLPAWGCTRIWLGLHLASLSCTVMLVFRLVYEMQFAVVWRNQNCSRLLVMRYVNMPYLLLFLLLQFVNFRREDSTKFLFYFYTKWEILVENPAQLTAEFWLGRLNERRPHMQACLSWHGRRIGPWFTLAGDIETYLP